MTPRALVAAAALLAASCITGDYNQLRTYQPPEYGAYDDLVVGITDVEHAMVELGAPLQVIEVGRGMALAWGWLETTDWNVAGTVPLGDIQGRVTYADTRLKIPGIVLFFDEDWRLIAKREGFLATLLREEYLPRDVEDELLGDDEDA